MSKLALGGEERLRALEVRTTTLRCVVLVQSVLVFGVLLVGAYLTYGDAGRLGALDRPNVPQHLERDTRLDALEALLDELGRAKHDAWLEERSAASRTHEPQRRLGVAAAGTWREERPSDGFAHTSNPLLADERRMQAVEKGDRATIRVDAPDGRAQFVMGARTAADNVIMEKEHADEGGEFTLSRNLTRVLGIGVDGGVTVHTTPLNVASTVRSADGSPLRLHGHGSVTLQSRSSLDVNELDGQGR